MLDDFLRKFFIMSRSLSLSKWERGEILIDSDAELLDYYSDSYKVVRARRVSVAPFFCARSAAIVDRAIDKMMTTED